MLRNKLSAILILVFIILIAFVLIINTKEYELNFLWSKGLYKKDPYSLKHTEKKSSSAEIKKIITKNSEYKWIRSSSSSKNSDIVTFANNLDLLDHETILITTDGDLTIPEDLDNNIVEKIHSNKYIKKWYTQNYSYSKFDKIKPYPIGFDLHTRREGLLRGIVNADPLDLKNYLDSLNQKNKLLKIFCDLHLSQNSKFNNERKRVHTILKDSKNIDFLNIRISQKEIFKKYNQYQFVISTHGNGLDCHRTWEAIYLGAIVITKTSSLDDLFKDLPVVIVKDWDECLDENNLKLWKDKYLDRTRKEYLEKFFKYNHWLSNY